MLARRTRARIHTSPSRQIDQASSVEPDDHYPLTCTPENGIVDAWEFEYLPFFAFAWKRSEELESYDVLEVHEHDQLGQEGHAGELSIILFIYIELY